MLLPAGNPDFSQLSIAALAQTPLTWSWNLTPDFQHQSVPDLTASP